MSSATSPRGTVDRYPEAARAHTEAGGRAFIEYFFDELNRTFLDPRPGVISSLSDKGCIYCKKTESDMRRHAAAHERYGQPPVRLRVTNKAEGAPKGQLYFAAEVSQTAASLLDGRGKVIGKDRPWRGLVVIAAVWTGGKWLLFEIERA